MPLPPRAWPSSRADWITHSGPSTITPTAGLTPWESVTRTIRRSATALAALALADFAALSWSWVKGQTETQDHDTPAAWIKHGEYQVL